MSKKPKNVAEEHEAQLRLRLARGSAEIRVELDDRWFLSYLLA